GTYGRLDPRFRTVENVLGTLAEGFQLVRRPVADGWCLFVHVTLDTVAIEVGGNRTRHRAQDELKHRSPPPEACVQPDKRNCTPSRRQFDSACREQYAADERLRDSGRPNVPRPGFRSKLTLNFPRTIERGERPSAWSTETKRS